MTVVFGAWEEIDRRGWIAARVTDGAVQCVECGFSVVTDEIAFKHTGDLGTYCSACSIKTVTPRSP